MRGHVHVVATALLVLSLGAFCRVTAQELSTEVFPSEDELLQALELGEISFREFVLLQELATVGLDSTQLYLLDEIPNLVYLRERMKRASPLQVEQAQGFLGRLSPEHGTLRWRFSRQLEDDNTGRSRYRVETQLRPDKYWRSEWRVHREYSGRERWIRRTVTYRRSDRALRQISLGNYITRFGLGTVIGYRGKLLALSGKLDGESFLFPDYGGFNGAYLSMQGNTLSSEMMFSYTRDSTHELISIGTMAEGSRLSWHPGLIVAVNRLRNRLSNIDADDIKVAAHSRGRYAHGYTEAELTVQTGDLGGAMAAVVEGRHDVGEASVAYALWAYGNRFADVISGSKATPISRTVNIPAVDFSFSSRRAGQNGLFIRTTAEPAIRTELVGSFLYGGFDRDDNRLQVSGEGYYRVKSNWRIGGIYLGRFRRRPTSAGVTTVRDNQWRLESRFKTGQWRTRTYIGWHTHTSERNYATVFASLRYDNKRLGRFDIWTDLARLDSRGIAYWYLYLQSRQQLFTGVFALIKFAHTYARDARDRYRPVVTLELQASW